MAQIGKVPEIMAVKQHLNTLKERGMVTAWELPHEGILTRLTAAVFFLTPDQGASIDDIWSELEVHPMLTYRLNEEKFLSNLDWRVEFNKGFQL